jgi:hypothetical protein
VVLSYVNYTIAIVAIMTMSYLLTDGEQSPSYV